MIDPTSFEERLAVKVTLTFAGVAYVIPGGAVKHIELDLQRHGFTGAIEFVRQDDLAYGGGFDDELKAAFLSQVRAEVRVELTVVHDQAEAATSPQPLVLAGLVTLRSVVELQLRSRPDQPLLARRYRLCLADPAQVLWTQHFPCRLYTERSLAQVIEAQVGGKIKVRFDWSALEQSKPQWFLHLPVEHGASFYDFVLWYVDRFGGFFTHDYAAPGYVLSEERAVTEQALGLFGDDIDRVELVVPPTPAHDVEICNTYAEAPRTAPVTQEQAESGIRHDMLIRSPIAQDADDRVSREQLRLKLPRFEAELTFARMPVVSLVPGLAVELLPANRWSAGSELVGKTWRVRRLVLRADAPAEPLDRDLQLADTGYSVRLSARLEQSDDPRPCHPTFRCPRYPGYVEGKIVSEQGEDGQKTYQNYRNTATSVEEYRVKVPAWADQTISAPFIPYQGSGSVFLPSYRDERVLLAIHLDHARIARLLAWREGAPMTMDVMGEQILLGKSATSNTSIHHAYEDNKPVFNVARTSDADTGLIRISEGTLMLRVQEKEQ